MPIPCVSSWGSGVLTAHSITMKVSHQANTSTQRREESTRQKRIVKLERRQKVWGKRAIRQLIHPGNGITCHPERHTAAYRGLLRDLITWELRHLTKGSGVPGSWTPLPIAVSIDPSLSISPNVRSPHQAASAAATVKSLKRHLCPRSCMFNSPVVLGGP